MCIRDSYYSTQRPVDIGTYPKPPDNQPLSIVNYDDDRRRPVADGRLMAWGEPVSYTHLDVYKRQVYYGLNALSHNVIMANRKKLKKPNGLFLGVPGSGKSFAAKRELVKVLLATRDRIIVVDPMGEYSPLIKRLGGQVIEIAPDSPHHINPMDIDLPGIVQTDYRSSDNHGFIHDLADFLCQCFR